jgi:hypothetical protein
MELEQSPVLKIEGSVGTNFYGINKLMHFYCLASTFENTTIKIDFRSLSWIDANLLALLNAFTYKLHKEKNVRLAADFQYIADNFNVFFRNGWLTHDAYQMYDNQETTIPCTYFKPHELDEFITYISNKLMCHRGMPGLNPALRIRIQSDLIEVFQNLRHARTSDPLFTCGQFYPKRRQFILTLVDLGVGFLQPIKEYTKGAIQTDIEAIRWAIAGNSSIINPATDMGGFGLQGIHDYCNTNKGVFQIYTGNDFWNSNGNHQIETHYSSDHYFQGSVINLHFNYDS